MYFICFHRITNTKCTPYLSGSVSVSASVNVSVSVSIYPQEVQKMLMAINELNAKIFAQLICKLLCSHSSHFPCCIEFCK